MGDVEEKDMGTAAGERVGEEDGEVFLKSAPNDELNSKVAHDVVPGDFGESIVAVAGSVDGSVEAPVLGSADREPAAPSGHVVGATEKVESWDLSEAVAKTAGDEKPKVASEEGASASAPVVSIGPIEDSAAEEPVSGSPQDKAEDSEHAAPSEVVGGEDVSPETPAEGSVENDTPVEAIKNAEPEEGSGSLEAVPSDDAAAKSGEVDSKDVSEDVAGVLPSESVDKEGESSEVPAEAPSEGIDSEALEAPVGSEKLDAQVGHEPTASAEADDVPAPVDDVEEKSVGVNPEGIGQGAIGEADEGAAEPEPVLAPVGDVEEKPVKVNPEDIGEAAIGEADEGSAEPESVSVPAGDVADRSLEVNSEDASEAATALPSESGANEDASPEHPVEGPSEIADSKTLDTPVDSEGLIPEVDDKVVEPTTSAEAGDGSAEPESVSAPVDAEEKPVEVNPEDIGPAAIGEAGEESAEPEPVSVPADDVVDRSLEVNSEDAGEAATVLPSESGANEDASPEHPAEGPSEIVDSKALDTPVDSEGLTPEVDDKVVEPTTNAEAGEGSAEPEPEPTPIGDVEEKSAELNPEDSGEAAIGEADEKAAEPEPVSAPADDVADRSIEVDSEDASEAATALPSESGANEDASPEHPAEGPSEIVDSKALDTPVDSEGLLPEVDDKVVEPTASAEADKGVAEPESVPAPVDVKEESAELSSEDIGEAAIGEADEGAAKPEPVPAPVDDVEEKPAEVNPEDIGEAAVGKADEGSAEPESVSVPAGDVEDRSTKVDSEDTSEAAAVVPSESGESENASPEHPAEGPSDIVDSKALEGLTPEVDDKVVEPTTSAEADEGAAEPEPEPAPVDVEEKSAELNPEDSGEPAVGEADEGAAKPESVPAPVDVEEKSAEVNPEDIGEAAVGEADEGAAKPEPVPAPVDVEEKSAEVNSEDIGEAAIGEADEGAAKPEPVRAPVDVEEKSIEVNAEDVGEANAGIPSESAENDDVSPEIPAAGPSDSVDSKGLEPEVVHEVVEPTSVEADEGSAEPESVSVPADDVADRSIGVDSEDTSEAAAVLPSESGENEDASPEHPVEGPSEIVDSKALDTPVDSEGLLPDMGEKAVEPTSSVEADEGSAEPEPVPAPVDVEEKSIKVNSEHAGEAKAGIPSESAENDDLSPEIPAAGTSDNVDSEGLEPEVVHKVVEPTSVEADEGSAEPESVSAFADDVGEKSIEENPGDTSEANTVLPSEKSADNEDVSREFEPVEGSGDNAGSDATFYAPAEEIHEVVETTIDAEPREEAAEPESVSTLPVDVENKSGEVNSGDVGEAATALESAEKEVAGSEPPAEESADNVSSEALEPEAVHEVVEPTTSAEPKEESAEPEPVSAPDHVEEKSVEVNSEDISGAATVLPSESADKEIVGSEPPAEESAESVSSEALEPEVVHEVVEPTTSAEPEEESAEPELVSAPDHVEEKSIEVDSEGVSEAATVLPSESADSEVVSSEVPAEKDDEIGDTAGASTEAKPEEESTETVAVSAPPPDTEDKSVVVTEAITEPESADKEVVSSVLPAEESADSSDALDAEALHEVVEPTTSEEHIEESAEPESVSAPADDVEDKSIDLNSEGVTKVATASESADNEDVSPEEPSAQEPSDNVGSEVTLYAPAEEVHEVVEETISAEPHEESAEPEPSPSSSDDVEDGFVMVSSRDVAEASTESESADNEIVSPELPAEGSDGNVSSEAVEPEAVHEGVEPTTSAEPNEGSTEPEHVSAPDHVEDKSIEVNSEVTSEAVAVLPSESVEDEVISRELPTEGSADKVDAPGEEIGDIEDAATHANPDEVSASLESAAAPSDDPQSTPKEVESEVSAPEMEEESIAPTSTPLPVEEEKPDIEHEHEHEQSEVSHEGSVENESAPIGVDTKEIDTAEHTSEELLGGATSGDAPEGLSTEEPSDPSSESHEKSLSTEDRVSLVDRCIQVEELPQKSEAESQGSVSMDTEVNAGDEGIAEGGDVVKEKSPETQSVSANKGLSVEDVSHLLQTEMTDKEAAHVATQPVEDVSYLLQTEMTDKEAAHVATQPVEDVSYLLQTVMTDEEVKSAAAQPPEISVAPEESAEDDTPALKSENSHGDSLIALAESSGASQENEVESASREFGEAPTTSEVVSESDDESHDAVTSEQVTPYLGTALATASGEKSISSEAAVTDTTPLEVSSPPPPVVEKEVAPRSYSLDEVATSLHDAAEKTLEDAKSSDTGDGNTSVAQSVAQIVLDDSSKTGDSSEYISGVVQDVAQLAQDAASSDPNILPDTVARVFDGDTAGSTANEASQPKESTSLGTMVSLFIVWCVSLCASHISSKDMPAPALKLAAEEVTAVLHSNAPSQPASSHEAASSNH